MAHKSILEAEVRLAEHKERLIFDIIHIRQEHQGWNNQNMVNYLCGPGCTKQEAREWLCKYKEHQMAEADEAHKKRIDQLAEELAEIRRIDNG